MAKKRKNDSNNFLSFFTGDGGGYSMSRLLCFLAFWPATFVLVRLNSAEALGWYLGAFVGGYVGGKIGRKSQSGGE